jgi:hypothetical protein
MPPVPSIWIPGRRRAPARIIQRAGPRQTAVPGNATADPAAPAQAAGAQQDAAARNVRVPCPGITLSDREGQGEHAHCRLIEVGAAYGSTAISSGAQIGLP